MKYSQKKGLKTIKIAGRGGAGTVNNFSILKWDVFNQNLDGKIDDPETIRKGKRVFYIF